MTDVPSEARPDLSRPDLSRSNLWHTARSPRMVALLLLFLAVAAVCARLGVWQLDRAQASGERQAELRAEAEAAGGPRPLLDVLTPQEAFRGDLIGTVVSVEGRLGAETLLVPGRAKDGAPGFGVVQPLQVPDAGGAVLVVARGWVPDSTTPLPPTPSGTVRVVGVLQAGEGAGPAGLPEGQVGAISPAQLVNQWGGPTWSGYVILTEPVAAPGADAGAGAAPGNALDLYPVPVPDTGLDVQNLAYALQWWIFGGFAVLLWWRLVRDEAAARAEEDGAVAS